MHENMREVVGRHPFYVLWGVGAPGGET